MLKYYASATFIHCRKRKRKKKEKKTEDTCSTEKFRLIWYSAIDKAKVS